MAKDIDARMKLTNGKLVITLQRIPFPKLPSFENGLIENLAAALGVDTEVLNQPVPISEQHYRAEPAAVQAMNEFWKTLSQKAFEEWERMCIVYEDEHEGHIVPLRGRLLLPTRQSIKWESAHVH